MTRSIKSLPDDADRRTAIAALDKSLLVAAGAGSGKTAVMAARVAMLFAQGVAPRYVAAITFTELAASELQVRVREFTEMLCNDTIPAEMSVALPHGLKPAQRAHLQQALMLIDELACSTIHGFCQRLIKPYPVEADIDPGATVMDGLQAQQVFDQLLDKWLWEALDSGDGGLLATLIAHDAATALTLLRAVAGKLRHLKNTAGPGTAVVASAAQTFRQMTGQFDDFVAAAGVHEEATAAAASCFASMAHSLQDSHAADQDVQLARWLLLDVASAIRTKEGDLKAFKVKGKWEAAVVASGLKKSEGAALAATATSHYAACEQAWLRLKQLLAEQTLARLAEVLQPVLGNFERYKRDSALLDFDDLIFAARALLRDHEAVRRALGARYRYLLVDEFQDTDPLQTEILWRLCGDPRGGVRSPDWSNYVIRPGALFLVGDPKQAIYRFRGADIAAYTQAREAFLQDDPASVVSISTNFRSRAPILAYVNQCFEARLNEPGQPGFIALDAFRDSDEEIPAVMALDVEINADSGQGATEAARNAEAEAVAALCLQLINQHQIPDRRSGQLRQCEPGDIALLAPMGTELWRYEAALERRGIPVASQAGKGFYRRQEVQDLIALTRVLADSSDTIAFGALLRGPLIGLTEEELLDLVWRLPHDAALPQKLPRLDMNVDPSQIEHPLAREVLLKLQALRRLRNGTTPHLLLSQAIDAFHVRAILAQRHNGQAERALANVDQYLAMSRHYAVAGVVAFATAMSTAWEDEARAAEGQPDVQEDAVTLFTVHAAKGLEWPIVVPVNMMTKTMAADSIFIDRSSGQFQCRLFGAMPGGYADARRQEDQELGRERIRLWYVAATRARDLLVLPRPGLAAAPNTWAGLLDLGLPMLPAVAVSDNRPRAAIVEAVANGQSQEQFAEQTLRIVSGQRHLSWRTPSRDEGIPGEVDVLETPDDRLDAEPMTAAVPQVVQGGRVRGLIIHKLLEEVLTGETGDDLAALQVRAGELIAELSEAAHEDAGDGLSGAELARCVCSTLALPQIAALRPSLLPEFHVYGGDGIASAISGIADAVSCGNDGNPDVVVDWKSDVDPSSAMLAHYQAQVRSYMNMTGCALGLIVLVTSGKVIEVRTVGLAAG